MSAHGNPVCAENPMVQEDVSVGVRGTAEEIGVPQVSTPLFEGAKEVICP